MNSFMESKNLDYDLQAKVRCFLEYLYKASSEIDNVK